MHNISFIIVTFNNKKYIDKAINSILSQKDHNVEIIIVDNNSNDKKYLDKFQNEEKIKIFFLEENLGYCGGNNFGISKSIDNSDLIIVMNPDIILSNNFLMKLKNTLEYFNRNNIQYGAIGPKLIKPADKSKINLIDSTGIFQKWYGAWYDRGCNSADNKKYDKIRYEKVPAICGALMVLNPHALKKIKLNNNEYFINSFFMYKEDIELSLRLKNSFYEVYFVPTIIAVHLRGWQNRYKMDKMLRVLSAKNELKINKNLGLIKFLYSQIKLLLVKLGL